MNILDTNYILLCKKLALLETEIKNQNLKDVNEIRQLTEAVYDSEIQKSLAVEYSEVNERLMECKVQDKLAEITKSLSEGKLPLETAARLATVSVNLMNENYNDIIELPLITFGIENANISEDTNFVEFNNTGKNNCYKLLGEMQDRYYDALKNKDYRALSYFAQL